MSGELRGPLFDGLDESAREALRAQLHPVDLVAGEILCHAGDLSDSLYVVERGVLRVLDGERGAILGRQRAGDVVGEIALLTRRPRSATLVAESPSVVSELSREDFLSAAADHPLLLVNLAAMVSRRLVSRTVARPLGRVTALVTPPDGWTQETAATAVAKAASATPLTVIDAAGALSDVLAEVYGAGRAPVLVRARTDYPGLTELLRYCERHVVVGHDDDPTRTGRRLARASIGLALGAGGAKGWAHVGVLRSLERAGYVVDAVAGSSIGAWVAAWVAIGHDAEGVEGLMRRHLDTDAVEKIFRRGGAEGVAELERVARDTVGETTFADLDVPLAVLAADLAGRRTVLMSEGPLADALVAAMTVPGLHEPARRGDQRLVDAVVLAPVPTEGLSGVDVTIGVNLLGGRTLTQWPEVPLRARAARDPVVESLELASHAAAAQQTTAADVPVTPDLGPGTWRDFHLADRFLAAGEEAMEAALRVLASHARPAH